MRAGKEGVQTKLGEYNKFLVRCTYFSWFASALRGRSGGGGMDASIFGNPICSRPLPHKRKKFRWRSSRSIPSQNLYSANEYSRHAGDKQYLYMEVGPPVDSDSDQMLEVEEGDVAES